jgi:hypothetical protein
MLACATSAIQRASSYQNTERDDCAEHRMLDHKPLDAFGNFPGFVVSVADCRSKVVMRILQSKAQLLEDPLRQILRPAIGADDRIQFHVQCWTCQHSREHSNDDIISKLYDCTRLSRRKERALFVWIVRGGELGLECNATEASEDGLKTCDSHCEEVMSECSGLLGWWYMC